jgi:hypothetical protein
MESKTSEQAATLISELYRDVLTYTPENRQYIHSACRNALQMAQKQNGAVQMRFNGIEITINPSDDLGALVLLYDEAYRENYDEFYSQGLPEERERRLNVYGQTAPTWRDGCCPRYPRWFYAHQHPTKFYYPDSNLRGVIGIDGAPNDWRWSAIIHLNTPFEQRRYGIARSAAEAKERVEIAVRDLDNLHLKER